MSDMHYDKGMIPPLSSVHGTAGGGGKSGKRGGTPSTRGASVSSGLSMQSGFHDMSCQESGHCTRGKNQVPVHPKKSVSTDHGDFTLY